MFSCTEQFARRSSMGWYSKFKGGARGNGFRLDHASATPSPLPHITSCRYSHAERDAGVTDHSMVIVDVE
jgi:exonuclease III